MKILHHLVFAAALICLFSACETVTVNTDSDRAANFGKYKSYALTPPSRGQTMSPASEAALRDGVRAELNSRGLTEAPAQRADLDIVRQVWLQEQYRRATI